MLTAVENALLTRVGPDTPMGKLQRRYWHPVAALDEMSQHWTKRVRLLGEDLVLFKDRKGAFGLVGEFCPHRRASLAYGIPTEDGIRCPYHGWNFDRAGRCLEQPNEPETSTFKDKVQTAGYPVETLGGLIWAYLGPAPAPLVPRWDGFVGENVVRMVGRNTVACNWLQIMENSLDPVHAEWLHGNFQEFVEERLGARYTMSRKHLKIDFAEFEHGIYKRRLIEGASEDGDDWRIGHPVLFPNMLSAGSGGGGLWKMHLYQIRVPVDDVHTLHYFYSVYEPPAGVSVPAHLVGRCPLFEVQTRDASGEYLVENIDVQDVMVWETQGPIARRDLERLGTTDTGVILYRNLLKRELAKIEAGEDPMNVIRDPSKNVPAFQLERNKAHYLDGFASLLYRTHARFSPIAEDLCAMFAAYNERRSLVSP